VIMSTKRDVLNESALADGQYILRVKIGDVFHFTKSEANGRTWLLLKGVAREGDETIWPNGVQVSVEDIVWAAKL